MLGKKSAKVNINFNKIINNQNYSKLQKGNSHIVSKNITQTEASFDSLIDKKCIDITNLKLIGKNKVEYPSISYLNINSLRNKITDLKQIICDIQPTILTISETKLDKSFPNAQFLIDGYYNPGEFRKDNTSTSGGMVTFVKSGTPCQRLYEYEPSSSEIMCIELNVQGGLLFLYTDLPIHKI